MTIAFGFFLFCQDFYFLDQRVHQFFHRDLPDKFAFLKQDPLALTTGNPDIGFFPFTDPIHHTPKHGSSR